MIHAITLSGGGAYGAYEVGVLKALMGGHAAVTKDKPFDPHVLTGTSAGAFIAALLLSADCTDPKGRVDHLEHTWLHSVSDSPNREGNGVYHFRGDLRRYLAPAQFTRNPIGPLQQVLEDAGFFVTDVFTRAAAFTTSREPLDRRTLELFDLSDLISTDPFRELVDRLIDIDRIRKTDRVLRIAATNWKTGELVVFDKTNITRDAVLASGSIPGIFPATRIHGDPYMDGGILMNTPLKPAIEAGAHLIHVVVLDPDIHNVPPATTPNTLDTFERLLNISNCGRIESDLKLLKAINKAVRAGVGEPGHRVVQVHIHRPRVDMGGVFGMLNFNLTRMESLIELGYQDAVQHDCERNGCVV